PLLPRQPRSTLFPYTTLFRSGSDLDGGQSVRPSVRAEGSFPPRLRQVTILAEFPGPKHARLVGALGVVAFVGEPVQVALTGEDRSEEHTSELQSRFDLVCRLL